MERLSTAQEQPDDWEALTGLLALTLAHCWLAGPSADGKLLKAASCLHLKVHVAWRFTLAPSAMYLSPVLIAGCPKGLSWLRFKLRKTSVLTQA